MKQQSWHHPADQIELKPKTTAEASRPWTIGLVARVTKSVSGDDEMEGLAERVNGSRDLRNMVYS